MNMNAYACFGTLPKRGLIPPGLLGIDRFPPFESVFNQLEKPSLTKTVVVFLKNINTIQRVIQDLNLLKFLMLILQHDGIGTPLRRGFGGVCLLQWSPRGDYLFSSHMDGVFRLWETESWTSEKWSSSGGPVVSARWSSDDAVLLMAFNNTTTLGALHFASKPPALDVQLLPVELPDIEAITGGNGRVEKMVWDYSGERLAISFSGGDDMHSGLVAIYDTRKTPILAISLMGFVRGPEAGTKVLALAFYDSLEQGLLLSVCWSTGVCCTYPLVFKSSSKQTVYWGLI
ncbi:hypothetical protein GOP47_0000913 [Adiantum capillus-veneris]|uniref:Aladin n=1 Tax=Adiantum capillus-veneris TaxID=13818 RepID=A0A9D4ZQZ1_ADICA|nr:hypothetical protein GOP47_0000913 [Adiantum capillus-veneris]